MATIIDSSRNLSYYAIPVAWLFAILPHTYAVALYASHSSKSTKAVDLSKPRTMLGDLERDQSVDRATKNLIIRAEGAHTNGIENLGFFATAVIAANTAGVDTGFLNTLSWGYVASRLVYNLIYLNVTSQGLSGLRTLILDITAEVARDYWQEIPSDEDGSEDQDGPTRQTSIQGSVVEANVTAHGLHPDTEPSPTNSSTAVALPIQDDSILPKVEDQTSSHPSGRVENDVLEPETPESYYSGRVLPSILSPLSTGHQQSVLNRARSISFLNDESAAAHLLSLREDASMNQLSSMTEASTSSAIIKDAPMAVLPSYNQQQPSIYQAADSFYDEGIFLQGSAYLELHETLRDRMFSTAKSNVPSNATTRRPTPDSDPSSDERRTSRGDARSDRTRYDSKGSELLTQHAEYELWKNWADEVAPWLDKFDLQCHFGHKLPALAKSHPHLRYSILALSARQLERKDRKRSPSGSLALYQEAIHLLLPHLQQKHTAVIASCIVLCVLEMMSCSPREWRRHLDGAASLLGAVGINGFVGGINQALFWVFARMDCWSALLSSEGTLIPITCWASQPSLASDIRLFRRTVMPLDTYANYAVYLSGRVIDLLYNNICPVNQTRKRTDLDEVHDKISFSRRWAELFEYIEDWYADRPEEMKPILYVSASEGENSNPFPILLFGNAPAVSGNQLYHTCALLMLQRRPQRASCSRRPKSILWHARRICAISISNTHHGCWTNSIQPLWLAGQVMSHPAEHRAILELYERIEQETGFGAKWRAQDLKELWGELD
ncbi:MAG: hypothetical protein Q9165_007882 [Trypethelium subeluteriae]